MDKHEGKAMKKPLAEFIGTFTTVLLGCCSSPACRTQTPPRA